jgi:diketogulonate reductase-like aldo/keto reductase
MAYSPVEQGRLLGHPALGDIARERDVTPAQVALAWLLGQPGVLPIPKAASAAHVRENRVAADLILGDADLAALNSAFSRPGQPQPLEMI